MTHENPYEREAAHQRHDRDHRPAGLGAAAVAAWRQATVEHPDATDEPERFHLGWWPSTDWFAAELAQAVGLHLDTDRLPDPWARWVEVRWDQIRQDVATDYLVVPDPAGGVHVFERPDPPVGEPEPIRPRSRDP